MPFYEYLCDACGHAFTHLARTFSDTPGKCPACGARRLRKQLSTFSPTAATPAACGSCASAPACPSLRSGGCAGACGH